MKKKNFKSLKLSKKSISNLLHSNTIGGKYVFTGSVCPNYCDTNTITIWKCFSSPEYDGCSSICH